MSLYDPRTYQKAEGKQYVIKLAKKKKIAKPETLMLRIELSF